MPSLSNMLARARGLTTADQDWIHQLVGDWQTIADVSFSDLLLIVQDVGGCTTVVAQCRPATASTFYENDIVGRQIEPWLAAAIDEVLRRRRRTADPPPGVQPQGGSCSP